MKIRTNYTFNSISFFMLTCFSNDLECCKCARWDFTPWMVWWYRAFAHMRNGCKECILLVVMLIFHSRFYK